jgi:hypothetical protein
MASLDRIVNPVSFRFISAGPSRIGYFRRSTLFDVVGWGMLHSNWRRAYFVRSP